MCSSSSMKESVFCVVLRWKMSLILLAFFEFDSLKCVFNTQTTSETNNGTGESFCVE